MRHAWVDQVLYGRYGVASSVHSTACVQEDKASGFAKDEALPLLQLPREVSELEHVSQATNTDQ